MPYYFFVWTPEIIEHLADHGVTPEEFEEVLSNPEYEDVSRSTTNPIAYEQHPQVDIFGCVYKRLDDDLIEPVTAYDVGE